jgi:hypothetical protein
MSQDLNSQEWMHQRQIWLERLRDAHQRHQIGQLGCPAQIREPKSRQGVSSLGESGAATVDGEYGHDSDRECGTIADRRGADIYKFQKICSEVR